MSLSDIADLYGEFTCSSGNCSVKSAEVSTNGGFYGTYGLSQVVQTKVNGTNRRRMLATTEVSSNSIKNPVVCVAVSDSMLFSIASPYHYPVYLKDSVLNSNANFDYGQFLALAQQMTTKQAKNNTSPSLFAFTFSQSGSYVFTDATDTTQLMLVRVTDAFESCPDPDRYIQSISADTVSSAGVAQKRNLIIKPDVPLIVGMTAALILTIVVVMVGVGYCLHKGWQLRKLAT